MGCALAFNVFAGGSGLNTAVVINRGSSNSLALGNYFCERRQVPPQNVLYLNWTNGNNSWTGGDFQTNLLDPLLAMLAANQLTNQIFDVALSMDIPFQTILGDGSVNSTTSALFYGVKSNSGPSWLGSTNSYAASEQPFAQAPPASAPGYSFLATMLTDNTLAGAQQLVDQGVNSDGTFPSQLVVLAKSSDPLRNIRYSEFDNAIFNTRLCGNYFVARTNSDNPYGQTNLLGYETGLANFSVSPGMFVPGAMADSLTSFGGIIFGPNGQTTLLAFTEAGAAGSYGTVVEPSPSLDKFPNPQAYFYQARGFSLAECYYQSLNEPYEGLIVGEPLAAPFARTGYGSATNLTTNAVLSGTTHLSLQFSARDAGHPLSQVDLFADGTYFETLTDIAPSAGNVVTLTINGYALNYTVPTNATVGSVAAGLAALVNSPANPNSSNIAAYVYGDRIELRATPGGAQSNSFYFTDGGTTNQANTYYRAVNLPNAAASALTPIDREPNGAFRLQADLPAQTPFVVQASTNLIDWLPIFTNSFGGALEFVDEAAPNYASRFYRLAESIPDPRPVLSPLSASAAGGFGIQVAAATAQPYVIQASTNLAQWDPILTNVAGGGMVFVDPQSSSAPCCFYRAELLPASSAPPQLTLLNWPINGSPSFRVDGATQPYVVETSTNLVVWTPLFTNLAIGEIQTTAASSPGTARALTSFLTAAGNTFLDSQAQGTLGISLRGLAEVGDTLQLTVTKTSGAQINLFVTNQVSSGALASLAQQMVNAVNSTPALQGSDGIIAGDLATNLSRLAGFNLYARSPGYAAPAIQAAATESGFVMVTPGEPTSLQQNLSDLQSRNHVYVTAGSRTLGLTISLDTTALSDGWHELEVVAYEGSNVRTQTRINLPIVVQNTPLSATMTLLDLPLTAPVQGTYHIQVAANTNNVSAITLFSTGGAIGTLTNQSTAVFTVNGPSLGAGLHPFYAVVQTAGGLQYRTQTQWSRLVPGS